MVQGELKVKNQSKSRWAGESDVFGLHFSSRVGGLERVMCLACILVAECFYGSHYGVNSTTAAIKGQGSPSRLQLGWAMGKHLQRKI